MVNGKENFNIGGAHGFGVKGQNPKRFNCLRFLVFSQLWVGFLVRCSVAVLHSRV